MGKKYVVRSGSGDPSAFSGEIHLLNPDGTPAAYARTSSIAGNAVEAGIDVTGNVDETVKINQFLQDCYNNQREAYFPRGVYRYSQLVVPSGLKIRGAGIGGYGINGAAAGTQFRQTVGANKHSIVFSGNLDQGTLQIGPVDISDIMFRGEVSNTSGSAIAFQGVDGTPGTIQDTVVIKKCLFRYWPQSGIYSPAGARPFHVEDCNFLWNGEYGIDFIQSTANYVQAVHFQDISGDGNKLGLVRLKGLDKHGSVTFTSVKSERRVNPNDSLPGQLDCLIFEDCDDTAITVNGLTHISSVPSGSFHEPPGAAMVVKGTGKPQTTWRGVTVRVRATDVAGTPATLKDEALSHSIAEGVREGIYGGTDGKYRWSMSAQRGEADSLANGESTLPRTDAGISSGNAMTSGILRLTYKTATKTEVVNTVQVPCGGTAAVPTPTLIRVGVYVEEANGDLTLVASSANNTGLFTAANAENSIPLSAPFTKIRGRRYAVGLLVVTASTPPTVFGSTSLISSVIAKSPVLAAARSGQTDLPSTVTTAQIAASVSTVRFYAEMLP